MKKKTLWEDTQTNSNFKTQTKNMKCDILIIGGGIAGISTAFSLKDHKKKIFLIEKGKIGMGVSARSTGKLTYLQQLSYHNLENTFSFSTALKYLKSQKEAIEIVRQNIQKYHINCNFQTVSSYTFTNSKKEIPIFKKEEDFLKKAKIPYQVINNLPINFPVIYGLRVDDTAIFHPVKYINELANILKEKEISVYENTMAQTLSKKENTFLIETNKGIIEATTVIVCTHYPFFVNPGFIPLKTHLEKDYICVSQVEEVQSFSAITNKNPIHSIRFHKDEKQYILYCSNSIKTNKYLNEEKEYQKVKENFEKLFHKKAEYIWQTHDIMTNDSLPFIGRIIPKNDNLLIATGFNKWGMTNGVLAGKILSDIILGKENSYESIFDPNRRLNFKKMQSFFTDFLQNASSYVKTKINKQKTFYPENVKIKKENGKSIGIYIDEDGVEHKVRNLCPHLKCNLIFNNIDKSWDCPCHGSKFDIDGNVIEGPSVYNIKISDEK